MEPRCPVIRLTRIEKGPETHSLEGARGNTQQDPPANGPQYPVGDFSGFSYNPRDRTTFAREGKHGGALAVFPATRPSDPAPVRNER
jgi:hypothetical protein